MRNLAVWLCGISAVVGGCVSQEPVRAADVVVSSSKAQSAPTAPKNVVWTKLVKTTANGNSLQKTTGCDGCADAGAVSEEQLPSGSGYMEFTASETNTVRAIGLTSGTTGLAPNEIKFSFLFQPGGVAEIRESGQYRGDTPFVPGDVFRIAVQGGAGPGIVRYYKNDKLLYRSSVTPQYPLVVSASLLAMYSTVNNVVLVRTP